MNQGPHRVRLWMHVGMRVPVPQRWLSRHHRHDETVTGEGLLQSTLQSCEELSVPRPSVSRMYP